jgi:hypothetical protein
VSTTTYGNYTSNRREMQNGKPSTNRIAGGAKKPEQHDTSGTPGEHHNQKRKGRGK